MSYSWDKDTAEFQIATKLATPPIGDPRGYPDGWNERAQFDKIYQWCKKYLTYNYQFIYQYPKTPPKPTQSVTSTVGADNTSLSKKKMIANTGHANSFTESLSWHITSGITVGMAVKATIGIPGASSLEGTVSTDISLEVGSKWSSTKVNKFKTEVNVPYDVPAKTRLLLETTFLVSKLNIPFDLISTATIKPNSPSIPTMNLNYGNYLNTWEETLKKYPDFNQVVSHGIFNGVEASILEIKPKYVQLGGNS